MNSIQQLTKDEGKCIIDGLLVPLLFQSELSKPQCEVINKSTSELNPSQRLFLLKYVQIYRIRITPHTHTHTYAHS